MSTSYLPATEATYRRLQTFDDVQALNRAVQAHRADLADELTETMRAVIDVISRHSCRFAGVSFLRKDKIGELVGKSRRTVIRICNRLEALGVIKQYALKRVKGDKRQAANAIVILPAEATTSPQMSHQEAPAKTIKSKSTVDTEIKETRSGGTKSGESAREGIELDPSFLEPSIPAVLYKTLKPFFNAVDMYEVVGVIYRAKASIDRSIAIEDYPQAFTNVIKSAILRHKRRKVKSFTAYLYASVQAAVSRIKRLEAGNVPQWLRV